MLVAFSTLAVVALAPIAAAFEAAVDGFAPAAPARLGVLALVAAGTGVVAVLLARLGLAQPAELEQVAAAFGAAVAGFALVVVEQLAAADCLPGWLIRRQTGSALQQSCLY